MQIFVQAIYYTEFHREAQSCTEGGLKKLKGLKCLKCLKGLPSITF